MQHAKTSERDYQHDTACTLRCQPQAPCSSVAGRTPAKTHSVSDKSDPFVQIQAEETNTRGKSPRSKRLKVRLCTVCVCVCVFGFVFFGGVIYREKSSSLRKIEMLIRQSVTYKGYWQKSGLFWAKKTRSDPVHMQIRSAKSEEKVRSS